MNRKLIKLSKEIRKCRLCADNFSHKSNPIFQLNTTASILIAGQAPGRKAHETSIPFDDPSGDRLRDWMGITKTVFYDASKIAILPMSFCYPGTAKTGDLPPRKECAPAWRKQALDLLPNIQLVLLIGSYAIDWHLGESKKKNLTETVKAWKHYGPSIIPLPHPSPRNNIWLKKNDWFERDVLPKMRQKITSAISKID